MYLDERGTSSHSLLYVGQFFEQLAVPAPFPVPLSLENGRLSFLLPVVPCGLRSSQAACDSRSPLFATKEVQTEGPEDEAVALKFDAAYAARNLTA